MTIKEMHIVFDLKYQAIRSNAFRRFLPEEIDILLHLATLEYIKDTVPDDFEVNTESLSGIGSLITNATQPIYIDTRANRYYAYPPKDMYQIVSGNNEVKVKQLCGEAKPTATNAFIYRADLPLEDKSDGYAVFSVAIDGTTIFDITDYYSSAIGNSRKFEIIPLLIQKINELSYIAARYDRWGRMRSNNNCIFASTSSFIVSVTDVTGTTNLTVTSEAVTKYSIATADALEGKIRLTKSSNLASVLDYSFSKTVWDSVVAEVVDDMLILYGSNDFIMEEAYLTYIKTPIQVNYKLGINSEVDAAVHDAIIDRAVKNAALYANNPNLDIKKLIIKNN